MNNYEINEETIAVMPVEYEKTKIIETNNEYIINSKAYSVMDQNCKYYGSTYSGRLKAAKEILNCSYKLPILVEESQTIIFFPTKSSLEDDCMWINFNFIKEIKKCDKGSEIYFKNNKSIKTNISKLSIENQISRSTRLSYIVEQRKKKIRLY